MVLSCISLCVSNLPTAFGEFRCVSGQELEFAQVPGAPVVRVNCMCPSFTDTAMAREGIDTSPVMKVGLLALTGVW